MERLGEIAALFLSVSLFAFGGAVTIVPEIHRQVVEVHGWVTDRDFTELYGIARAAPGPNILVVALVGYRVAGFAGALVATVCTILPAAVLVYSVAKVWDRFKGSAWRDVIEAGVAPVTVGLVAASAFVLTRAAGAGPVALGIVALTAFVTLRTAVNPLWVFAAAGALGAFGLV